MNGAPSPLGRAAGLAAIAAALLGLGVPVLGGLARPGYDACSQYISELGELGAAHGGLVSLAGFLPTGVLLLVFLALAAPILATSASARLGAFCLLGLPSAYIVAAFARCDPGCPASGSSRQLAHNAFGLAEYLGGALGLWLLAGSFRAKPGWRPLALPSALGSLIVLASFAGMVFFGGLGSRGAIQRVAEATLFLWVAAVGVRLRTTSP